MSFTFVVQAPSQEGKINGNQEQAKPNSFAAHKHNCSISKASVSRAARNNNSTMNKQHNRKTCNTGTKTTPKTGVSVFSPFSPHACYTNQLAKSAEQTTFLSSVGGREGRKENYKG